ncbi:MAG: ribulose-phosphate 3-epimerase [Anaerovoracaceae bacterium]|jgi:ribulose-phosphate 3-epimerase
MKKLAPSILSADFGHLASQVELVEKAGADLIHVDVMDGHFVPNISYGATVMKSLLGRTKLPFDVHLMIEDPDKYIEDFVTENTRYITVHQEACPHLHRTIAHIRENGVLAGAVLNPATPVWTLEDILDDLDMVLLMSVNPGFGGQSFIEGVLGKIARLAQMRAERGLDFEIEVDGGISLNNVKTVSDAGADVFVAGSSVFKADDPAAAVAEFIAKIRG